ncbi:MAG: hypothetical protein U0736_03660 [Gemmataceae bacterium]
MPKRNRERIRHWLAGITFALGLAIAAGALYWQFGREQPTLPLRYGDLVQSLRSSRASGRVSFQKVNVGPGDIRGMSRYHRSRSTPDRATTDTQTVPFRTLRLGFERASELYSCSATRSGASYQGAEDQTTSRMMLNGLMSMLMPCLAGLAILLGLCWSNWRRLAVQLRPQQGPPVRLEGGRGHSRRGRHRSRRWPNWPRGGRLPQPSGEVPVARRANPQGRVAGRPPGTGKTRSLGQSPATGVPFFSLSGLDFVEMFVGCRALPCPRPSPRPGGASRPASCSSTNWTRWARRPAAAIGGHDEPRANAQPAARRDGREPSLPPTTASS